MKPKPAWGEGAWGAKPPPQSFGGGGGNGDTMAEALQAARLATEEKNAQWERERAAVAGTLLSIQK